MNGLIKLTSNNTWLITPDYQEAQVLKKQIEDDEKIASEMQKQMEETPNYQPDQER